MNINEKKGLIEFRKATMKKIIKLEHEEEKIRIEKDALWDIVYYIDDRIE